MCPVMFNRDKCCDDEFQFPTLSSTRDNEKAGFTKTDMWTIFVGFSSLIGVVVVILVICSCCPGCNLYKRRNNWTVYKRFGRGDTSSGRKKKGSVNKGVKKTKTSVPSLNQIPSVTVVASQPVQVNFPQSYTPEQIMGHAVYNQLPQPQAVMQSPESPPHCIVAVTYDSRRIKLAHNPIYRQ
ncbi:uncharacterized protein LOC126088264 [Schistocerca cancellata]|uniref:uncharacterized protein LOC126088264 n=1 Tax=Schistocerca cancellata TaxID=274614 RepID=UPI0021175B1D|nr:uncharacterized protein LOC126088264 [Schistocerca cancellata]